MKKNNTKDTIIKIVLLLIIILLLGHNYSLLHQKDKEKEKEKTPSGNVNIIEITCNQGQCDKDNKDLDRDKDSPFTLNKNNNSNNNSNNNTSSGESTYTIGDDGVAEPDNELFVRDDKIVWNDTTQLKIFSNSFYDLEGKIAPETSNTYQFVVKNSTSYRLKYEMSFIETNPYHINMKYKLKKNNDYIVDHYVTYNELDIINQYLDAKTNDTFYIEWKWFSDDSIDTIAGENDANYALKIEVKAESVND